MKTIQEKIAIMQAFANGKKIESKATRTSRGFAAPCCSSWVDSPNPEFNWGYHDYRVKKEPVENRVLVDKNGKAVTCCAVDPAIINKWDMCFPKSAPHRIHTFLVDPI